LGHLQRAKHALNLSDQQVTDIETIFHDLRTQNQTYRDSLHGAMADIATTLINNPNDLAAAQALLDKQEATEHQMKVNALQAASKALNVLTPEQRGKLGDFIKEHHGPLARYDDVTVRCLLSRAHRSSKLGSDGRIRDTATARRRHLRAARDRRGQTRRRIGVRLSRVKIHETSVVDRLGNRAQRARRGRPRAGGFREGLPDHRPLQDGTTLRTVDLSNQIGRA